MGKRPDPSLEELEFYFECMERGLSNSEVKEEVQEQTEFPLRQNRFLNRLRREYEAAKFVLEFKRPAAVPSVVSERMKDHFNDLLEVVETLLANDLDCVSVNPDPESDDDMYTAWAREGHTGSLSKESLALLLGDNLEDVMLEYDEWEHGWFASHLEADVKVEFPAVGNNEFANLCMDNPYEVIETLKILRARKTFRGKCPVCKAWQ